MAIPAPSPDSSPTAVPPSFTTTPSPTSSSPPQGPQTSLPPAPSMNGTDATPPISSPPRQSPPAVPTDPPPPTTPSSPPPTPGTSSTPPSPTSISPPPPSNPPKGSPPPPPLPTSTSPPPPSNPPKGSPPPPSPTSTSPPPPSNPPKGSPPPPLPTSTSPPPPSNPPKGSPPPSPSNPTVNSPPPSSPPKNSPPPESPKSPESPPLPLPKTPETSPPSPASASPPTSPPPPSPKSTKSPPPPSKLHENSPPPSKLHESPPPPALSPLPHSNAPSPSNHTSPPLNSPPKSSPPPSIIQPSSPPPSHVSSSSPSAPSPNQNLTPPPNATTSSTSPSAAESLSSTGNGAIGTAAGVAIGVVTVVIVLSIIGLAVWCMRKRRRKYSGLGGYVMPSPLASSPKSDLFISKTHSSAPLVQNGSRSDSVYSLADPGGSGNSRSWFTYEELVKATNGFSDQNLLGEGGFGSVYKGYLPDGREVAVKQLKIGGGQGEREFKAEVEIISRIHHRHLVSLVGYCISENRRLLVYDYVPNNTLYFHLHGEGRPVLDWATRVKVAAGSARGLAYLHEDCHPRIIHRDIKSSNILLDNNFEARVSDFGLAKLVDAKSHITTRVMGTFGYMAPEYASSGKLTDKSDVFSFGVVLLELITGRKPVDVSQPLGDESLVEWARPLLSHALDNEDFKDLADPMLEMNYVENEMFHMIEVAAACVRHSAAKRPRMGQVVRAFDGLATSDLTNGMRLGESEAFDSAQQSAEIRLFQRMAFGSQDYSTEFFSHSNLNS